MRFRQHRRKNMVDSSEYIYGKLGRQDHQDVNKAGRTYLSTRQGCSLNI